VTAAAPRRGAGLPLVLAPALLAPCAAWLGHAAPGHWLLPLLAMGAAYPVMALLVIRGRPVAATLAMLLWAASLSVSIIGLTSRHPVAMGRSILQGPAYRDEMFSYVRTGVGRESDPRRYLPQHLMHTAAFLALTLVSGGAIGILLGAVLVDYMSYYVGCLVAAGGAPLTGWLLGWPPWALLRVLAFVLLGVALSRPLLSKLAHRPLPLPRPRRWYAAALLLLLVDVVLKGLLASHWALLLRACLASP
jgi:hypothetical protein